MPPDEIIVEDVPGDEGAFVVKFEVVQFQQRMRISKRISLEFIARGAPLHLYHFTSCIISKQRHQGACGVLLSQSPLALIGVLAVNLVHGASPSHSSNTARQHGSTLVFS